MRGTIDKWAAKNAVSRSEAIRRLVEIALTADRPSRAANPKGAPTANDVASNQIDALSDRTASDDQRASRKRRLLKGPREFQDMHRDRSKPKGTR